MPHDHSHSASDLSDAALLWAVVLNVGLSVFEFAAGVIAGSVALLADALHNTNDAAALLIALVARRVSRRKADRNYTFGYRRAELIGAMIQLTALILVGIYLIIEAIRRVIEPQPIEGSWMMWAAGVALVVDVGTAWLLWSMSRGSLNVRAAFLHNLTDAGASIAVLAGGAAILWLDWNWVDPALTLMIAGYILFTSQKLLRRTSSILMEGAPDEVNLRKLQDAVEALEDVHQIHHLHVWQLDEDHRALEAHVVVDVADVSAYHAVRERVRACLREQFDIHHATLELESRDSACTGKDAELVPGH